MLASYPQRPSQSPAPQFGHCTQSSPSGSADPYQFTSAFTSHSPSPAEIAQRFQQQQYFDLFSPSSLAEFEGPSPTAEQLSGHQLMSPAPLQLQNPPIRVQRSSPTPVSTSRSGRKPSSLQNSMLAESVTPNAPWQQFHDDIRHAAQGGVMSKQPVERRGQLHRRAPSGSSIGSAGPASPFDSNVAHPYIANTEQSISPAGVDSSFYHSLHSAEQAPLGFSKHLSSSSDAPPHESFLAPAFQNYNPRTHDSMTNLEAKMAMFQALRDQAGDNDSNAPGFSSPGRPSIASIDHHSPATPQTSYGDDQEDSLRSRHYDVRTTPKLDRTMSDVYQDELYNPAAFSAPSTTPQVETTSSARQLLSPYHNVFSERLQAANNEHLHAQSQSPINSISRARSPFLQGSQYAASTGSYDAGSPRASLGSAAHIREQQKAEADAVAYRQHQRLAPESMPTPNTISPKDALLDYHESVEESKMPLFTSSESIQNRSSGGYATPQISNHTGSSFTFAPPSVPGGVQMPQQYPFISQRRRSRPEQTPEFPAHLISMESSASESMADITAPPAPSDIRKPMSGTSTDSGTYTCTYHGCTLRFESPAKLQKHKREGHRSTANTAAASTSSRPASVTSPASDASMTSPGLLADSQAGPHKCERINPSTGKPCNTIFSRPYDLTRHEDTIHNNRKQKVRCQLCTEDKSFSRNDALTRHMRVVHPEVEFGSKSRRRFHA